MSGRFAPVDPAEVAAVVRSNAPRTTLGYSPGAVTGRAFFDWPATSRPVFGGAPRFPFQSRAVFGAVPPRYPYTSRAMFGDFGGDVSTGDALAVGGAAATGNVPAVIYTGAKLLSDAFSSGSVRDQQRAARANYFGNLAVNEGNVAAAQLILGALVPNVSGNELPMWQVWIDQLSSTTNGKATLEAAQQLGPKWFTGSSDTVTSYPIMKNYAATWSAQHPAAVIGSRVAGAVSSVPGWLPIAAVVGVGIFLATRRRR